MTEHPEDRAARLAGEREAAANVAGFAERHQAEIWALVSTYNDAVSHEKLDALREEFWTSTPAGSQ